MFRTARSYSGRQLLAFFVSTPSEKLFDQTRYFLYLNIMMTSLTSNTTFRVLSHEGFASVRENLRTGQKTLFADQSFQAGNMLCTFSERGIFSQPARLTLQTGINQHILLAPEFLQYVNHSCSPNIFFDTTTKQVLALKNIQAGEELVFFYPSTEWDMAEPFICHCGASNCLQQIRGAAYLPAEILRQYWLTDFIYRQLRQQALAA